MYDTPEGPELLFTRRAWHLRSHAGQVSFPGGRLDVDDENLVETALRETEEEIGLDRDLVSIFAPRLRRCPSGGSDPGRRPR